MQNILVVEDDHDLNQAICYSLKSRDMELMVLSLLRADGQSSLETGLTWCCWM